MAFHIVAILVALVASIYARRVSRQGTYARTVALVLVLLPVGHGIALLDTLMKSKRSGSVPDDFFLLVFPICWLVLLLAWGILLAYSRRFARYRSGPESRQGDYTNQGSRTGATEAGEHPQHAPVKVRARLEEEDVARFLCWHSRTRFPTGLTAISWWLLGLGCMGLLFSSAEKGMTGKLFAVAVIGASAGGFLMNSWGMKGRAKRYMSALASYPDGFEYEFSDSGIRFSAGNAAKDYPWCGIESAVERKDAFYIVLPHSQHLILPKRCLDNEAQDALGSRILPDHLPFRREIV